MSKHIKPLAEEMDRLGHVTDRVNLIYSHSGDEAQLAASEAIERRWRPPGTHLRRGVTRAFKPRLRSLTVTQTVTQP
jgi:hypothetical protein